MARNRDSQIGVIAMFRLDAAAARMTDKQGRPLKRGNHFARLKGQKRRAQNVATTSSRMGVREGGVSCGIGLPSFFRCEN
jgi:hypothetical protein